MATKESKGFLFYLAIIPGLIAFLAMLYSWYQKFSMSKTLSSLSMKDDNKIRNQRNLYKKTLESAILKAADRIQNNKTMQKDEITVYKDEKSTDELIDSYKKEV